MRTLRASLATGTMAFFLLSVLVPALPVSSAVTTVNVTIPVGANNPANIPGFRPQNITVVIGVNNTVVWTNVDPGISHTVATTAVPAGVLGFGSGNMATGATFSYTFTVPGTYQYDCSYHPFMTGAVVVLAGSATPTPEFPAALLALILFAVIAAVTVAAPRLGPRLQSRA